MKDKLKTLKDITLELDLSEFANDRINIEDPIITYHKEIKAEAIKWVKEIRERMDRWYSEGNSPNDLVIIEDLTLTARGWDDVADFIIYHNNLTDGDLE